MQVSTSMVIGSFIVSSNSEVNKMYQLVRMKLNLCIMPIFMFLIFGMEENRVSELGFYCTGSQVAFSLWTSSIASSVLLAIAVQMIR